MNKILEVVEKREKETKRTGSMWDWVEGYPESQWALLCSLENGKFFEDENEITFHTTEDEKIGLTKDFLVEKTSNKAIYGAPGTVKIEKNLIDNGIFEITDRVGHYIKIRVEPMFDEIAPAEQDYKFVRLNGQRLALLYIALSKGLFKRPKKGQIFYEGHNDGTCTLFFKRDYYALLTDSIFTVYYQGKFTQSNAEADWNDLKEAIDKAKISERDDVENLKLYSLYDE